jgi:hypothetical protein
MPVIGVRMVESPCDHDARPRYVHTIEGAAFAHGTPEQCGHGDRMEGRPGNMCEQNFLITSPYPGYLAFVGSDDARSTLRRSSSYEITARLIVS